MYKVNLNKQKETLEIRNDVLGTNGKIHIAQGASLQELMLNGQQLIADLSPLPYEETFASAILFPFANRIKDGSYSFENKTFQLATNKKEENNALHGLVYNKMFELEEKSLKTDSAKLKFKLEQTTLQIGFPFPYSIWVTYLFEKNRMDLKVEIKNTGDQSFPFTLGWHPYFLSENLNESHIQFKTKEKVKMGGRNIASGLEDTTNDNKIQLGTKNFDDCWVLDHPKVVFKSPKYDLELKSSESDSFLQIYTPPKPNVAAIEPTTGISNSFNNEIGLKTLAPNEVYKIEWSLKLRTK